MSIVVNVNGESINYPQTGDTNWGDETTDFAVQTSSALAKVGLSTGTTVDIPGTLDVTGNTTLDANLSVGGNASVAGTTSLTGNVTLTNNLTVNGVVYADDDTTANTPVISFIDDTNTGIGRSAADTLDLITGGNSRFRIESTGQIKAVVPNNTTFYPGYLCRAWVNFNGRGTVGQNQTIRGSANISSVVKNATGDYTINIDIDMPDANYATFATGRNQGSSVSNNILLGYYSTNSFDTTEYNAGSVRITSKLSNDVGWVDLDYISVGIFR